MNQQNQQNEQLNRQATDSTHAHPTQDSFTGPSARDDSCENRSSAAAGITSSRDGYAASDASITGVVPLATCSRGEAVTVTPADGHTGGEDLVVLSGQESQVAHGSAVTVCRSDGTIAFRSADLPVTALTDPARRAALLQVAVEALARRHAEDAGAVAELRRSHAEELQEIRRYAIARHLDGDICRDGLNEFLTHFGLARYPSRLSVRFTISGSYEVDGEAGDVDAVTADARSWLKLDLSDIDAVVEDSETIQVEVDSVAVLHD